MAKPTHKILVVDDDRAVRTLLNLALSDAGYAVVEAAGGAEALNKIRRTRHDLVVLDINMPDVSGYDVLAQIRQMPSRRTMPVLVVTANGHEPSGVIREVAGAADGRVTKPFSIPLIEHAVAELLGETSEERARRHRMQSRAASVYQSLIDLRSGAEENDNEPIVEPRRRLLRAH